MSPQALEGWLADQLAMRCGVPRDEFDPARRFRDYGLDSAQATAMITELGNVLGRELRLTLVWEHPTPGALTRHLVGVSHDSRIRPTPGPRPSRDAAREPIAVVGMACRFPGAASPRAFWQLLRAGGSAITEVPRNRWSNADHFDPDPQAAGKMITRWGGFVEDLDRFDAGFFAVSPREALQLDPQQRLMLELSWEALEDAGLPATSLRGRAVGVFFGAMWADYDRLFDLAATTVHSATGRDLSVIAGRVSYTLGLSGPSMVISTACSSSLVAVHQACASLDSGESTLALAGGVNAILTPHASVAMSKFGGMAPDGRCKAFDARADGYVRGEGGGVVVLKKLSRALGDGDPIYCVIRGSAVNNDGFSNGLTAPNPRAQEEVLEAACARARISPQRVQYVEAHGTGTRLGDPIEATALGKVMGVYRPSSQPLLLGSVKTNIGHLEAAAGIAGFIKTALAISHRQIPATRNFTTPNPLIPFAEFNLRVADKLERWPDADEPATAGVSAFGFGGTNCHAILESVGPAAAAIRECKRRIRAHMGACRSAEAARGKARDRAGGGAGVVFVCSGNGAQWPGMGRELLQEVPAFRRLVGECDEMLGEIRSLEHDRPVGEARATGTILAALSGATLSGSDPMAQLGLFTIQVGLAEFWRSFGLVPDAVIGHSVGEVAAAHIAGALSLGDALTVVWERSCLQSSTAGRGAMAVVEAAAADTARLLEAHAPSVAIAAENGPESTVVTGTPTAIRELLGLADRHGVRGRDVAVDIAGHSAQMEPLCPELASRLAHLRPRPGTTPFLSTVTGAFVAGSELDAEYWVRNLRVKVRFGAGFAELLDRGFDTFVELGPHPVLTRAMQAMLGRRRRRADRGPGRVLPSMSRRASTHRVLAETAASLAEAGYLPREMDDSRAHRSAGLFVVSARTRNALREAAKSAAAEVERASRGAAPDDLGDLFYTSAVRREHHDHRLACIAESTEGLLGQLRGFVAGERRPGSRSGRRQPTGPGAPVFVFSGQGSQWPGMGRNLFRDSSVFREALIRVDAAMAGHLDWSVVEVIRSGTMGPAEFDAVEVAQPLVFAVQVALADMWKSLGIVPRAVIGHSMGEVAAAHVAGAIELPDAARLICERSRILARIRGRGAMLAVELTVAEAREVIREYRAEVHVAVINGPRAVVLSGAPNALQAIAAELAERDVFHRRVRVDVAAHSPQVEPLAAELTAIAADVCARRCPTTVYSTVTGGPISGSALGAEYWTRNLCDPVLFAATFARLLEDGCDTFIEVSPHPILTAPIGELLREADRDATVVGTLRRDHDDFGSVVSGLSALWVQGQPVDLAALHPDGGQCLGLWSYPWQRQRYWPESESRVTADTRATVRSGGLPSSGHRGADRTASPLLGSYLAPSLEPNAHYWETEFDGRTLPYLSEHRVHGQPVVSAAVYLAMVLDAADRCFGDRAHLIEDIRFHELAVVPGDGDEEGPLRVQLAIVLEAPDRAPFRISTPLGSQGGNPAPSGRTVWRTLVSGTLRDGGGVTAISASTVDIPASVPPIGDDEQHRRFAQIGIEYGSSLRNLANPRGDAGAVVADIQPGENLVAEAHRHRVHPALVESCLQAMLLAQPPEHSHESTDLYLTGIARVLSPRPVIDARRVAARSGEDAELDSTSCLLDRQRRVLVAVEGVRLRRVTRRGSDRTLLQALSWRRLDAPAPAGEAEGSWLVFGDETDLTTEIERAFSAHGAECIRVYRGGQQGWRRRDEYGVAEVTRPAVSEALRQVAARAISPVVGIIYLWGLGCRSAQLAGGSASALARVIHELGQVAASVEEVWPRTAPRLCIVTRHAHPVGRRVHPVDSSQSALWGLARVLAGERPSLRVVAVDLGTAAPRQQPPSDRLRGGDSTSEMSVMSEVRSLVAVLRGRRCSDVLAIRDGHCYGLELRGLSAPRPSPELELRDDATYLITGGLGGVGLAVAERLAELGARHILLISRRAKNVARATAAIERRGARTHVARADVADEAELAAVLRRAEGNMPPIRGIVHAAGISRDARLVDLDEDSLAAVLAPKVDGALNLHRLIGDQPLDFAVYFSSLGGFLGLPGQGGYAAANAFLDGLAAERRTLGLPALSIAWCGWRGIGLASSRGGRRVLRYIALRGIGSLDVADALDVFESLLCGRSLPARVAVMPEVDAAPDRDGKNRDKGAMRARILTLGPAARQRAALEDMLVVECAQVLGMPAEELDRELPLNSFGMDSLLAMEVRNRLEIGLTLRLPATLLWKKPTIRQLAAHLHALLTADENRSLEAASSTAANVEATAVPADGDPELSSESEFATLLGALEDLSESEVRRLLEEDG